MKTVRRALRGMRLVASLHPMDIICSLGIPPGCLVAFLDGSALISVSNATYHFVRTCTLAALSWVLARLLTRLFPGSHR